MKYSFTLLIMLAACLPFAIAQEETTSSNERPESSYYHQPKSHSFSLGAGFPNVAGATFEFLDLLGVDNEVKASPQITARYEYGITEELGIGMQLGYYTGSTGEIDISSGPTGILCDQFPQLCEFKTANYKLNAFQVAARVSYHFKRFKKLDTYGSTIVGYSITKTKNLGDPDAGFTNLNAPTFVYYAAGGGRYFITPQLALYAEIGYGNITIVNAGLTYRLGNTGMD